MIKEKTPAKAQKAKFKTQDVLALSLKGHYRVEQVECMSLGSESQEYYVLGDINSKTIHKTYVPVALASAQGARELVSANELMKIDKFLGNLELRPEDLDSNSNKKMIAYEKRIKEQGFWALIDVYLCVDFDLKKTKRSDKRYVHFLSRIQDIVVSEVELSLGCTRDEANEFFESRIRKFLTN